jgi:hypothetical protein
MVSLIETRRVRIVDVESELVMLIDSASNNPMTLESEIELVIVAEIALP